MTWVKLSIASASLLAVGACEHSPREGSAVRAGAPRPVPPLRSNFLPSNAAALPQDCPKGLRPTTTLRVRIKKDFSTIEDDDGVFRRRVAYKNYAAGTDPHEPDDDAIGGETTNRGHDAEFADNPFHIDLSTLNTETDRNWIRVKVVLRNEKFEFNRVMDRKGAMILGVSRDRNEANTEEWFCQMPDVAPPSPLPRPKPEPRPIDLNGNNKSVLTFYIKRKDASTPGSINLHVISRGQKGRQTPIIIDPRIRNEG